MARNVFMDDFIWALALFKRMARNVFMDDFIWALATRFSPINDPNPVFADLLTPVERAQAIHRAKDYVPFPPFRMIEIHPANKKTHEDP